MTWHVTWFANQRSESPKPLTQVFPLIPLFSSKSTPSFFLCAPSQSRKLLDLGTPSVGHLRWRPRRVNWLPMAAAGAPPRRRLISAVTPSHFPVSFLLSRGRLRGLSVPFSWYPYVALSFPFGDGLRACVVRENYLATITLPFSLAQRRAGFLRHGYGKCGLFGLLILSLPPLTQQIPVRAAGTQSFILEKEKN